jgi:hypothetical protein
VVSDPVSPLEVEDLDALKADCQQDRSTSHLSPHVPGDPL